MKKTTKEWLIAAKDDLDVIDRIITDAHLSHIVAFHAQQCIEKAFKALLEENDLKVDKIHNIVTLYGKVADLIHMDIDLELLLTLDSLYIEARYPGEMGLLPDGKPSVEDAEKFMSFAYALLDYVKSSLE